MCFPFASGYKIARCDPACDTNVKAVRVDINSAT